MPQHSTLAGYFAFPVNLKPENSTSRSSGWNRQALADYRKDAPSITGMPLKQSLLLSPNEMCHPFLWGTQ